MFITLFSTGAQGCCGFYQSHVNYAEPKPFPEPNRHTLDFLHPILLCRITYWAPLEMLLLCIRIILQTLEKEREKEEKKRERRLKLSGTCRLNAMKEQRTPKCLLDLCTTQKKKLLSLTLPPSPQFYFIIIIFFEFLNFKVPTKSKWV